MFGRRKIRTQSLRVRRRRIIINWFATQCALVGAVVLLFSQLSMLPAVSVAAVRVEGNRSLTDTEIKREVVEELGGYHLNLFSRRNILLVPRGRIKERLRIAFSRLGSVNVDVNGLTSIIVFVRERDEVGVYCKDTGCFFIDARGFIFDGAPHFTDNHYLVFSGELPRQGTPIRQQLLPQEEFDALLSFVRDVERMGLMVERVRIEGNALYELVLRHNGKIMFDPRDGYATIKENLALALSSDDLEGEREETLVEIEYIDLRFGNRIFYKLRDE